MSNTYGIIAYNNGYIDTSNSLLGAKNHATRNGYEQVFIRFNSGYHTQLASDKSMGYWVDIDNFGKFFDGYDLDCSVIFAVNAVLVNGMTIREVLNEYEYRGV